MVTSQKSETWICTFLCLLNSGSGLLSKPTFHHSRTGASSRFGFTFVGWREQEGRVEAGPFTEKVLADFEKRGEPWLWGVSGEKLESFFEGTPWKLIEEVDRAGIEYFACVQNL